LRRRKGVELWLIHSTDGYHGYVYNGFEEPGTGPGGANGKGLRGVAGGSELVREA